MEINTLHGCDGIRSGHDLNKINNFKFTISLHGPLIALVSTARH
jgi:hypothetical protein